MNTHWLRSALKCCGKPTLFYTALYGGLGLLFLGASLFLDPGMAPVGLILLLTAAGILGVFFIVAFLSRRPDSQT